MRRLVLLLAAMALALVVAAGAAFADPINSKKAPIVTFDCDGEQVTVTFLLNPSVVFNVVDTTGNFVLTRADGTATFTDPETEEVVQEDFVFRGQGKREGLQDSLTTCTTTITFEDPVVGPVTVDFTFTGFFTPRKG
jgi:hypothetical protein